MEDDLKKNKRRPQNKLKSGSRPKQKMTPLYTYPMQSKSNLTTIVPGIPLLYDPQNYHHVWNVTLSDTNYVLHTSCL